MSDVVVKVESVEGPSIGVGSQGVIKGDDGFSPVVSFEQIEDGYKLTIVDANGAHEANILNGAPGQDGDTGPQGIPGADGQDGSDGFSPTVSISEITGGHRITITDAIGAHSADVMDGENGADGQDGTSPVVSFGVISGGHTMTVTDKTHPTGQTINIMDGVPGPKGDTGDTGSAGPTGPAGPDGISPVITVTDISGGHRVTITDAEHPTGQSFDVMDGAGAVSSVNGQTGEVTLDAEDVGALPNSSTLDDIPDGETYKRPTAAQLRQIGQNAADIQTQSGEINQLQTDVDAIERKIPNQASAQNQLADKDFVNSSINSAAAYFRGAFPTRAALFAVSWQTADPQAENYVSNNDYAYVADDETHNDEAWRYIYVLQPGGTDNGWQPQFKVNESPLTAAQLAALNSGATAALIEQISTNAAAIALKQAIINAGGILKGNGNGQVSAAVAGTDYATPTQVNAKYTKPVGGIPASDMAQAVQTSLGLADTALQAVPNTYRTSAAQDTIDAGKQAKIAASGMLKGDGNGGVTAATAGTDYQAPLIAGTDYETPAGAKALGLTGASVGDFVRVNAVDANGKPTSWKRVALNEIKCNKNLLDNWYFVGGGSQLGDGVFPINQRGQSTYSGPGYGIDRWYNYQSNVNIAITSDGITITRSSGSYHSVIQKINNPESLRGKKITASLWATGYNRIRIFANNVNIADSGGSRPENELNSATGVIPNDTTELFVSIYTSYSISTVAKAVKLELGSEQTLAHNEGTEESPVWVLNEIPDYGEELAKCQRYYQLFRTESLRPTYGEDCRPTMATEQPTKGTLTKNGVTYYTLSSEP